MRHFIDPDTTDSPRGNILYISSTQGKVSWVTKILAGWALLTWLLGYFSHETQTLLSDPKPPATSPGRGISPYQQISGENPPSSRGEWLVSQIPQSPESGDFIDPFDWRNTPVVSSALAFYIQTRDQKKLQDIIRSLSPKEQLLILRALSENDLMHRAFLAKWVFHHVSSPEMFHHIFWERPFTQLNKNYISDMYRSVISEGLMDTPTLLRYIEQNYKIASTLSLYLDALVSDPRKYILDSLQIGDNPSPSARDTQLIIGQQFTIWKDRFSPEEQSALVLRYGREILPHPRIDMNPENDTKRIAWVNEDIASGNFFSIPDAIKPTDILDLRTIKTTLLSKGEYETLLRGSRMFDLTLAERHEYTMAILRDLDRFSIRNFFEFVDQGIVPVSTYPSIKTTLEAKDMIYTMVYSQIYPQYYGTSTLVEILIAQDRIGNLVEHINKLKPNAVQTTKLLGIVLSAGQRYQEYVGGVIRYQEAHFGR